MSENETTEIVRHEEHGLALANQEAGVTALVVREKAKMLATMQVALHYPRDVDRSCAALLKSVERQSMAEKAQYKYPRAQTTVKGPSVYLAREAARVWGNISCETQIVSMDDDFVHIRSEAIDLETNTRKAAEAKIKRLIQRKNKKTGKTEWVRPDERDLREMINRHAAFLERNMTLQLIPKDIIDDACEKADATLKAYANGEIKTDKKKFIRSVLASFLDFNVSKEMIESYLGHEITTLSGDEAVDLRQIRNSLNDGNSRVADHFAIPERTTAAQPGARAETGTLNVNDLKPAEPTAPAPPAADPTAGIHPAVKPDEGDFQDGLNLDEEI